MTVAMRIRPTLAAALLLAGCGEAVRDDHFANTVQPEAQPSEPAPLAPPPVPVRIGELGASFAACNAVGTTRRADAPLPVRAAPFETAEERDQVPAGQRFFVCSRSLDQRWFGIVWPDPAEADCGVSDPVARRRDYDGPCRSGWVQSAFVKLVAG